MNKKGLLGKIFLLIILVIILAIGFIAISIYQAYSLASHIVKEVPKIQENSNSIITGDCEKLEEIKASWASIRTEIDSTCKNPLINYVSIRIEKLPTNCLTINEFEATIFTNLEKTRIFCEMKDNLENPNLQNLTINNSNFN